MESIIYHRGSLATALKNTHIMQKWLEKDVVIAHTSAVVEKTAANYSFKTKLYL